MRFAAGLLLAAAASAQRVREFAHFKPSPDVNSREVGVKDLGAMNIEREIEIADREQGLTKMVVFGKIDDVNADFFTVAQPEWERNGIVWTASWRIENAYSLAVHFDKFDVPDGGALYVVGKDREVLGAFTHETKWKAGNLMTKHMHGNQVTIQYFQHRSCKGKATIHVDTVTGAFRDPRALARNAAACNIQAQCAADTSGCNSNCAPTDRTCSIQCTFVDQDTRNEQWAGRDWFDGPQSAATNLVSASGSRFCSASFINNVGRAPLLLTAAHCNPGSTTLIQQYWRDPSCQSTANFDGEHTQVGDLSTLARRTESDMHLLHVGEADANTYLAGWDATNDPDIIENMVAVHHPASSNMKISHAGRPSQDRWSGSGDPTHWRVNVWTEATTEPGSSGSPLYHQQTKRILGQLHGGSAACPALNGYDVYGGVWRSMLEADFARHLRGDTGVRFMDGRFLHDGARSNGTTYH